MSKKALLLGNEAIAQAIVASGCQVASAYPGTPSSELLPAIAANADRLKASITVEWAANEKIAFEIALSSTFAGARACAVMKQVGLNVAADPFMSGALLELKGGMLLISADDPGPYSSQNEQDSRFFAMFAQIPCLDPSDALEAAEMVNAAYTLSEAHGVIVMLRPTTRVAHSRQIIDIIEDIKPVNPVRFDRNPARWVCLPGFVRHAHPKHNKRVAKIRQEFEDLWSQYNYEIPSRERSKLGIIASGVSYALLHDLIREWGREDISVLKIGTPYPLPDKIVNNFISKHEKVLILEETYPVIEMQIINRTQIMGRWNGYVPSAGELLPQTIKSIIKKALQEPDYTPPENQLALAIDELYLSPKKPVLCPGCPHRSSIFSIRKAFPNAIIPSDIGCYTLAINQKGLDTSLCMGAAVTTASGLYLAHKVTGQERPIIATIGDSTFFHMGAPGLLNAVHNCHAFVLCILDNSWTAMTGGQSHPGLSQKLRNGDQGIALDLEALCRGCGVTFIETVASYDTQSAIELLTNAWDYAKEKSTPAVLIFRHPCILLQIPQEIIPVAVLHTKCIGCRYCIDHFGCPALSFDSHTQKTSIDERYCINCGACLVACPHGAIVKKEEGY